MPGNHGKFSLGTSPLTARKYIGQFANDHEKSLANLLDNFRHYHKYPIVLPFTKLFALQKEAEGSDK